MISRNDVLDAAAHEFAQHGYAASSLASISAHLGLTKGALVRKFPTEEDFAWGIVSTLRQAIARECEQSLALYPNSGIKAMIRFFVAIDAHMKTSPQLAAAVVLVTDRASPAFAVSEVLDDWKNSLFRFFEVAQRAGELSKEEEARELAEYVFLTNMGEAIFGARPYGSDQAPPNFQYIRRTLRQSGVVEADRLIDDALESQVSRPADSLASPSA